MEKEELPILWGVHMGLRICGRACRKEFSGVL